MAEFIVSSYFEDQNGPATRLAPSIRIWEVNASGNILIIGDPCGTSLSSDGTMTEIEDCGSPAEQDGFYKYIFTDVLGYDSTKTYLVRVDGGGTLPSGGRYQAGKITPADAANVDSIVDGVWSEQKSDQLGTGTIGEAISLIRADTLNLVNKLYLDADSVLAVTQLLLKLEAGRTKINTDAKTLTVYDEDCTTVLRTFSLFDADGVASVTDICERVPTAKGPSDQTTITDTCP